MFQPYQQRLKNFEEFQRFYERDKIYIFKRLEKAEGEVFDMKNFPSRVDALQSEWKEVMREWLLRQTMISQKEEQYEMRQAKITQMVR